MILKSAFDHSYRDLCQIEISGLTDWDNNEWVIFAKVQKINIKNKNINLILYGNSIKTIKVSVIKNNNFAIDREWGKLYSGIRSSISMFDNINILIIEITLEMSKIFWK